MTQFEKKQFTPPTDNTMVLTGGREVPVAKFAADLDARFPSEPVATELQSASRWLRFKAVIGRTLDQAGVAYISR